MYVVWKPSFCNAERKSGSKEGSSEAMWTSGRRGGKGMVVGWFDVAGCLRDSSWSCV
jgi:hypothetical protein